MSIPSTTQPTSSEFPVSAAIHAHAKLAHVKPDLSMTATSDTVHNFVLMETAQTSPPRSIRAIARDDDEKPVQKTSSRATVTQKPKADLNVNDSSDDEGEDDRSVIRGGAPRDSQVAILSEPPSPFSPSTKAKLEAFSASVRGASIIDMPGGGQVRSSLAAFIAERDFERAKAQGKVQAPSVDFNPDSLEDFPSMTRVSSARDSALVHQERSQANPDRLPAATLHIINAKPPFSSEPV